METVEIIIRIPKERYEEIKQAESKINTDCYKYRYDYWFNTAMMIANGTVLPKNHGRLIDADELIKDYGNPDIELLLENMDTIIEADKVKSE